MTLEERINALADCDELPRNQESLDLLHEFREALNRGDARVIDQSKEPWQINLWVKKGILLHVGLGTLQDSSGSGHYFELDTFPRRKFTASDQVRVVADSSFIRDGVYLAPRVTCMSSVFINIGAHIGADSVLDSNCMVGLCTQIGERVRIGPGTQIGGVISPLEAMPCIIGDDVSIGGNCGIYEGVSIGQSAVVMSGVILEAKTRLYDLSKKMVYKSTTEQALVIPPRAVVAPGAVPIPQGAGQSSGLWLQTPVIIGYHDETHSPEDMLSQLLP